MFDRNVGNTCGVFNQTQVGRDLPASLTICSLRTIIGQTPASRAKVKIDGFPMRIGVSASAIPYAARLDAVEKFQGMRSSMRLRGCPSSNARNVSER